MFETLRGKLNANNLDLTWNIIETGKDCEYNYYNVVRRGPLGGIFEVKFETRSLKEVSIWIDRTFTKKEGKKNANG